MLDPDFDPLEELHQLHINQQALLQNQNNINLAVKHLAAKVEAQGHTIDILVKNLETTNKTNELLLQGLLTDIQRTVKHG